jgi:hypothetical protein
MKKRILVCDWRPSGFEEVMNEGSGRFVGNPSFTGLGKSSP